MRYEANMPGKSGKVSRSLGSISVAVKGSSFDDENEYTHSLLTEKVAQATLRMEEVRIKVVLARQVEEVDLKYPPLCEVLILLFHTGEPST